MIAALAARDPAGLRHAQRVTDYAARVSLRLGLDDVEVEFVEHVALLHDVGKLSVPDRILHKPGPLDEVELTIMRDHAAAGGRILSQIPELAHLARSVRATHERWSGTGYPDGLRGAQIPLASRITAVCDAYEAMTSPRPYRGAMPHQRAVAELERHAGRQFCPTGSEALLGVLEFERAASAAFPRVRTA